MQSRLLSGRSQVRALPESPVKSPRETNLNALILPGKCARRVSLTLAPICPLWYVVSRRETRPFKASVSRTMSRKRTWIWPSWRDSTGTSRPSLGWPIPSAFRRTKPAVTQLSDRTSSAARSARSARRRSRLAPALGAGRTAIRPRIALGLPREGAAARLGSSRVLPRPPRCTAQPRQCENPPVRPSSIQG
jgi:hypothetical protein